MSDIPGTEHLSEGEHAQLLRNLERRIEALHRAPESEFGEFHTGDWVLCVGGFVIVPYLLYLWFWP